MAFSSGNSEMLGRFSFGGEKKPLTVKYLRLVGWSFSLVVIV